MLENNQYEYDYTKNAVESQQYTEECAMQPNYNSGKRTEKKRGKIFIKLVSLVTCALIFGSVTAVSYYGVNKLLDRGNKADTSVLNSSGIMKTNVTTDGNTTNQSLDVSDIVSGTMASMVSITSVSVQEVENYFSLFGSGPSQSQKQESSGSGIIISQRENELLIVTNNHVIENSTTLSVCFVDSKVCQATVKGADPDNDLAVISVKLSDISEETKSKIKVATTGDSDGLKVGQQVVAIGNALGYGQSVTTGIVSALNRQIDTTDSVMIQTDAAINPGNSGGALLDMNGKLVGINSAKFSSTEVEGMGYAIAINNANPIIEDLMNRTTREKVPQDKASYLGISGEDVTSSIAALYGIPQGIYITSVANGSPAEAAGLTKKTVITHFDGIRVTGISNLENRLKYYAAGETVNITVQVSEGNSYKEKSMQITLGSAKGQTNTNGGNGLSNA